MMRRCIPSEKVEEILSLAINELSEQFQQFRIREMASTSGGQPSNAAIENLDRLIKQARQDFEAQLTAFKQDVKFQVQECNRELHQLTDGVKAEMAMKITDEKWEVTKKLNNWIKRSWMEGLLPPDRVHIYPPQ